MEKERLMDFAGKTAVITGDVQLWAERMWAQRTIPRAD